MARKNHKWTTEEKERIVKRYLDENMGSVQLAAEEGVSSDRLVREWVRKYLEQGISGLENRRRPGNPYAALHTSKSLSKLERLRLTVAKHEVEIARLKKGYNEKGCGANKEYVTTSGASIKSLKK